jgi:hypothetical protein
MAISFQSDEEVLRKLGGGLRRMTWKSIGRLLLAFLEDLALSAERPLMRSVAYMVEGGSVASISFLCRRLLFSSKRR